MKPTSHESNFTVPRPFINCMCWCVSALITLLSASSVLALEAVRTVKNIWELQAVDTTSLSSTNCVIVQGYYSQGDRGGGNFHWWAGSTATIDNGRYFGSTNTSSSAGRWERLLNGETANVKMWGARGNIENGNYAAAADDTDAIQRALTACCGTSWTTELLFPSGGYKVTDTLVINLPLIKIRGESARMAQILMPPGITKDILRGMHANNALNGGSGSYEENIRIEDITINFIGTNGAYAANATNACIAICMPIEGTTIKNVGVDGGGYGIRCFGGGAGATAAFRDIVCGGAIAGISIEPVPGSGPWATGHVLISGATGDHRYDASRSNACMIKFSEFAGLASVEGVDAEGVYGGGVIQAKFPDYSTGWGPCDPMGLITIKSSSVNFGNSWNNYPADNAFLVLKGGLRTPSVTLENINAYAGSLIRDELTGRVVMPIDAYSAGLSQGTCRFPICYESISNGKVRSRLVVGDKVIYRFAPPTNGWYRIMQAYQTHGDWSLGGTVQVTSNFESSEFSVDIMDGVTSDAAEISYTRRTKDVGPGGWGAQPCVTEARAGIYSDGSGNRYGYVDLHVEHAVTSGDIGYRQITVAYSAFDSRNLLFNCGMTPLVTPTTPEATEAPSGCTVVQTVTTTLIR